MTSEKVPADTCEALKILGVAHVVLPREARQAFPNLDFTCPETTEFYQKTFDQAKSGNQRGTKWRFFPVPAASIQEIAQIEKIDLGNRADSVFSYMDFEPKMVLVNFQGLHKGLNWYAQNGSIIGGVRARERYVFVGALLFLKLQREVLLPDWAHWGASQIGTEGRLFVGNMNSGNPQFGVHSQNDYSDTLRVCIQKEPDRK